MICGRVGEGPSPRSRLHYGDAVPSDSLDGFRLPVRRASPGGGDG